MNMNKKNASFWLNNPVILFEPKNVFKVIPLEYMNLEEKMNAISRLVILLSLLGLLITKRILFIYIGLAVLLCICFLYTSKHKKEGYENKAKALQNLNNLNISKEINSIKTDLINNTFATKFTPTNKNNPFGNVLLTDIMDNPNKLSAAPAFNPDVKDDIISSVKQQTQMLNPGIKNTSKQIYGDLWEKYNLDNSLLQFNSTPNTRVMSDQGAFAEYLYGNMPSAKENTVAGNIQRVKDNGRYIP